MRIRVFATITPPPSPLPPPARKRRINFARDFWTNKKINRQAKEGRRLKAIKNDLTRILRWRENFAVRPNAGFWRECNVSGKYRCGGGEIGLPCDVSKTNYDDDDDDSDQRVGKKYCVYRAYNYLYVTGVRICIRGPMWCFNRNGKINYTGRDWTGYYRIITIMTTVCPYINYAADGGRRGLRETTSSFGLVFRPVHPRRARTAANRSNVILNGRRRPPIGGRKPSTMSIRCTHTHTHIMFINQLLKPSDYLLHAYIYISNVNARVGTVNARMWAGTLDARGFN